MLALRVRTLIPVAAMAVLCAAPLRSQPAEGRLSGVVRDTTGAAVPGATVTVTNTASNAIQTATSGADGAYSVSVPPGVYTVVASLRGFGRQTRREIRVDAGATVAGDFTL